MVKSRKHILLVPLPALGHIIPLLELGKKIVKHHDVTFAVSACMVEKILQRELLSTNDFPLIAIEDDYVDLEIDVNHVGGTEELAANMAKLYTAMYSLFKEVPAADKKSPSHGITSLIDAVIVDNLLAGPAAVCHERRIPFHHFNTQSMALTLGALMLDDDTPTVENTTENNLGFGAGFEAGTKKLPPGSALFKAMMLPIRKTIHLVSGIIVNSVRDMDKELIEAAENFPDIKNIPIRFVGPLGTGPEKISQQNSKQQNRLARWLDEKPPHSVVYVSFGTLAFPSVTQLTELVNALIQLNKPFIFSLAAGQHKHLSPEITAKIATQFEHGQFLILPWAPQKLILQHPATAVFLSHCGWNSTLESVVAGMPVVAWPMFVDQQHNAKWLSQNGLAELVEGTGLKGIRVIPSDEIVDVIRKVGWVNDGSTETTYRQSAQKWREIVADVNGLDGPANRELQDLMESI